VLPESEGQPITCSARTTKELEARYKEAVSVIETLHAESIVCGDLCLDSFRVSRGGTVSFFAVLGDVRLEGEDEEFTKTDYLAFRPAEQRFGGMQHPSVDVYALGWIAEEIFDSVKCEEESGERSQHPRWLKNVLHQSSSEDARRKTATAASLRQILEAPNADSDDSLGQDFGLMEVADTDDEDEQKRVDKVAASARELNEETEPSDDKEMDAKGGGLGGGRDSAKVEVAVEALKGAASLFSVPSRVLLLLLLNLVALGILLVLYVDSRNSALELDRQRVDATTHAQSERVQIQDWYDSDAPGVHGELLKVLEAPDAGDKRTQMVEALLFRSRRLGLSRSADVVLRSYSKITTQQGDASAMIGSLLLRVVDPHMPPDERLQLLAKLYNLDAQLAVVMAASLALDTGDADTFRGILARAVSDQAGIPNGGEHSPFALILLLPQAHDLFSEDIIEINDRIPSSDISWLLEELGKKGQAEVSTVAQLAYNRRIATGPFGVFLKELQRGAALSQDLRSSLVAGALGKLSIADINRFGEWYGQGAPRVLEAGILTTTDPKLEEAAFEALSTKAISDPYVANVMEFMKSAYEGDSAKYAGVVAMIALRDVVDSATIDRQLGKIAEAPRMNALLKELVRGAPPEMLEAILNRYSASMDPLDVVDLLGHPSPAVRIVAVSRLSQCNDIMLLKLISQSYEEEQDPDVRAAYEKSISVIREQGKLGV
jgi:hypothetical protein